jgi:hypothetical protein
MDYFPLSFPIVVLFSVFSTFISLPKKFLNCIFYINNRSYIVHSGAVSASIVMICDNFKKTSTDVRVADFGFLTSWLE